MKKYFLSCLLFLLSIRALCQVKEEFCELIFYIPTGLTVTKTPNNMVLSDGQSFSITVNKSIYSLKNIEKSFPDYWRESLLNEGVDNPDKEPGFVKAQTNAGWNCFRGGKTVSYNGPLPTVYYHLTVMRYLGITLRITSRASTEELFRQKYPLLMQLVSSVGFKDQPATNPQRHTTSTPPQPLPQGSPPHQTRPVSVQLNTLYLSVQGDLLTDAQLSVLYFLPGGHVFTDIPENGFLHFNMQELKTKFPERFGTFNTDNFLSVKLANQGSPITLTVEPGGSLRENGNAREYKKIDPLDNYQWEGTFVNVMQNSGGSILFSKDGRFADKGLVKTLLPKSNEPFPDGEGTYSSRQNSLLLQYSDGRKLQLCFYMMPEDFQKGSRPNKILINHYLLRGNN